MTIVAGFNPPTATDEEEFVSPNESAPQAAAKEPESSGPKEVECRYCTETFKGPAGPLVRGRHEKKQHPTEWAKDRAGTAKMRKPSAKKTTAKKTTGTSRKATTRPASTTTARRTSAADTIKSTLEMLGGFLSRAGADIPTCRALLFSAPAVGEAADDVLAGTVVDRYMQPFVKSADKWERVGGTIGFPIMVAIVSAKPDLYQVFEGQLRSAALDVLIGSVPSLKKQAQKERDAVAALAELGEVDERYRDAKDPLGLILADIFGYDPATIVVSHENDAAE